MSEDQKEWEVETILQRGRFNNITHYLVHWKGYPKEEATWEPILNLENCEDAIMQFESQFKCKEKGKVGKIKRIKKEQIEENQEDKRYSNQARQIIDAFNETQTTKETGKANEFKLENETSMQLRQELNITKDSNKSQSIDLKDSPNQQKLDEIPPICKQIVSEKDKISNKLRKKKSQMSCRMQKNRIDDNGPIQIPPRKRIKLNALNHRDKSQEFNKQKSQNEEMPSTKQVKYFQTCHKISETETEYLSKIADQNNQIRILKEMFQTLIPYSKQKINQNPENKPIAESLQRDTQSIEKKLPFSEQNHPTPKELLSKIVNIPKDPSSFNINSELNKEVMTMSVPQQPQNLFSNKASLLKNTSRYEQCDQEHLAQKKTTLRNIIRKNLGLELGKHKVRTLDISDESLLELELGEIKRLYVETQVEKLELLVKLPYGWVVVGRNREKELFISDVNLIKMEYWTLIVNKYLAR